MKLFPLRDLVYLIVMSNVLFVRVATLFLAIATALPVSASDDTVSRPNLIWIMADDLGYGDLGCYGQEVITTPHLDRMAEEGMRFTQFYAGATVCAPSRSVLMTGQHHGHTRVRGNAGPKNPKAQALRSEDITVAKVLQQSGYRTALVGKWGLGDVGAAESGLPRKHGFEEFFGYLNQHHAHNHFPDFLWRNEDRIALPNVVTPVGEHGGGYATEAVQFADDLFADEAIQFVTRNKDEPFFLYWSMVIPHANNERTRALKNGAQVPDFGPYADEDWPEPDKGQAAMISRMDSYVGRMLATLRELGLAENTLVIFTSDNGPHNESNHNLERFHPSGPLTGIKRSLTDGGIRVPMIAWWPGKVPAGFETDHVAYFGDWMATAAELTGAKIPDGCDSISFAPTLLVQPKHKQPEHEFLYWEFHEGGFKQAALYQGRWKGIRSGSPDSPVLLYDLQNDLAERTNVTAKHPEIATKISDYLKSARLDSLDWKPKWSNVGDTDDIVQARKELPFRETRDISGWQVHVDKRLLENEADDTAKALAGLKKMLDEIVRDVPAPAVVELKKVPLYFSPAYKRGQSGAEFHPDAGWLRDNGRDPAMAKGVEFSGVHDFEAEMRRMPNFALHELAHAYHFRVLPGGFDNEEIRAAYEHAKSRGIYEHVERWNGDGKEKSVERAYGMASPMEYFAETTEAYFSRNDFFPFTRNELFNHDPMMYALLEKLWGVPTDQWLTYPGGDGPGKGKHVVLIAAEQEYRSEQSMPMMAKILSTHHGFDCTVLFGVNEDGYVDPTLPVYPEKGKESEFKEHHIPGLEKLDSADLVIFCTRLLTLPDSELQQIVKYVDSGRPIIALRTANHGFQRPLPYKIDGKPIRWGEDILGGTFLNHHGRWHQDSTRGILVEDQRQHPILTGVIDIWGDTDVYRTYNEGSGLPADCTALVWGQPLMGRKPDDLPNKELEPLPVAWVKPWTTSKGMTARVFHCTMGSGTDLKNPGLRRLVINAVYWGMGMETSISSERSVEIIGSYEPLESGFNYEELGVKPRPVAFYR